MQPKSSFIVVLKFSNTSLHTQLDESYQHIIPLFLHDNFTIPSVTKVVSCFHYVKLMYLFNTLISHFFLSGTCPAVTYFLTLLF